jgi:glycosyltransferase involved in cell wall biosynthesis
MRAIETYGVSFVIPAYNEATVIAYSLERLTRILSQKGLQYELIVVDDGSTDGTRMIAKEFGKKGRLRLIGLGKNVGKGCALRIGFAHSQGKKVVFFDADLDIQADDIACYVSALDCADVIVGSKGHPKSRVSAPAIRRLFSYWFNVSVRLLTGLRLTDTQTGLKAVNKNAVRRFFPWLKNDGYVFDVELLIMAHKLNLRIAELPVEVVVSSSIDLKRIWTSFIDLLLTAYRLRVVKYYDRLATL